MTTVVHEIQGYAIVLDKVVFLTRVFKAEADEGFQFNIVLSGDVRLSLRFPTRHDADLERAMLIQAIRDSQG